MDKSLIFLIPIAFLAGVFLPRILNADLKITSRTKIKRDHFHIPLEESEEGSGRSEWLEPDDAAHSVILETVEKCWKKLYIFESFDDPNGFFKEALTAIIILLSLSGLANELTGVNDNYEPPFAWMDKLWVIVKPYAAYICISIIAIIVIKLVYSWITKRARLLNDVRRRKYYYQIFYKPDPGDEDAILEVSESNAPDYVHIRIYHNKGWRFATLTLKVDRQMPQF